MENETKTKNYDTLSLTQLAELLNNRIVRNESNKIITAFALKFLQEQKRFNLLTFPKEYLSNYFNSLNDRKQQRLIKAILNELISKNLIAENEPTIKAIYRFREKQLKSFDYGSYALMMLKNGYKRNFYIYEKNDKCNLPKRKKVLTLAINEQIPQDDTFGFDESEINSNKSLSQQKVLSNGIKSRVKEKWYNRLQYTYKIL